MKNPKFKIITNAFDCTGWKPVPRGTGLRPVLLTFASFVCLVLNCHAVTTLMVDTNNFLAGVTNLGTTGSLVVSDPATGLVIALTNGDANGVDGNFSRSVTTTNLTATNINGVTISSSSSFSSSSSIRKPPERGPPSPRFPAG